MFRLPHICKTKPMFQFFYRYVQLSRIGFTKMYYTIFYPSLNLLVPCKHLYQVPKTFYKGAVKFATHR